MCVCVCLCVYVCVCVFCCFEPYCGKDIRFCRLWRNNIKLLSSLRMTWHGLAALFAVAKLAYDSQVVDELYDSSMGLN